MSKVISKNHPCLNPACGSSDARQIYEEGTSFCFSCRSWFPPSEIIEAEKPKDNKMKIDEIELLPSRGFKERGITKTVAEYFKVKVGYGGDGNIDTHYYPYDEGKAYKIRSLPKQFSWEGKHNDSLFGMELFNGGGVRLVITEGEIDALTVAQANMDRYKKIYPVVSISSSTMLQSLIKHREWIRSFQEVIIWFDNDEAGFTATEAAIKYIGIDKVKIVKSQKKDANELYLAKGFKEVNNVIWDAAPYVPSGIVTKEELWNKLVEFNNKPSIPYPPCLDGVNLKTKGHREGEITLFISGTGAGKSTLLREDMLHILKTTKDKIGIVSLEESPEETARKLSGMILKRNPAKDEISLDDLKIGFDAIFGEDRIVLLNHAEISSAENSIIDKLEYMALSGCKYLYLDHITILVSEGVENLQGNEAQDKMMNHLARLVKRHPIWVGVVSHLRKVMTGSRSFEEGKMPSIDDIKGSGSIKQISYDIVAFARDMTAEDPIKRNTIKMSVLKCRFTGLTGPVQGAFYDYDTGRLLCLEDQPNEDFVTIQVGEK